MKKILYVDMDGVLVDFKSGINSLSNENRKLYENRYDECPGIFSLMKPIDGSIEAFKKLSKKYDIYILSTSPWNNPGALSDKLIWVQKYLGTEAYKRVIFSHNKNLNIGDYLIDDRTKNGAGEFSGELIQYGTAEFKNWDIILTYLIN